MSDSQKKLIHTILVVFITLVLFSLISIIFLWNFRVQIFEYFAKEYLAYEQKIPKEKEVINKITEKIIEKESIFTQEYFIIDAVKKTNPAVVSISIFKDIPKYEYYIDPEKDRQFKEFFGDSFVFPQVPQYRQNGTEKKQIGGGSGFFVSKDGLIVTNRHVVEQKDVEYTVFTNDGKKHSATVIARDPILDVALIKIKGNEFPFLPIGNSDSLQAGQTVIAIGNALGEFRNTVSVGVISGLSRSLIAGDGFGRNEFLDNVIQTDAAINHGNSGGPLLDLSGNVIGINVAIAQGSQSIGFALPSNSFKNVIDSVKATGKIVRPLLGIRYININKEMQEKNNLSVDYGVLVQKGLSPSDLAVIPGSAADKAGIVENDIILEVDGRKIDEKTSLAYLIREKKVGQIITLKILHQNKKKTVKVTLEAAKDNL